MRALQEDLWFLLTVGYDQVSTPFKLLNYLKSGRKMTQSFSPSTQNLELSTLQELFFKDLAQKGRSMNTLKNYRTDLDCFNLFVADGHHSTKIHDYSLNEIKKYGEYLDDRYNSDNSKRRRVQALRLFFDFLVQENIFPNNPVRSLPTSPKFVDRPRPTPYIDVKTLWHSLLDEVKQKKKLEQLMSLRNQVVMLLIYEAGLKVSDLASIKRRHLFLDSNEVRVLIEAPRRDPYTVPLPAYTKIIFENYLEKLSVELKRHKLKFDHILFNANPHRILSGGLSSRGLEMIFEEYRHHLMITLTPKSLRQSCIFKWMHAGLEDSLIKEWLGLAPSYSLKPYRDLVDTFIFDPHALEEITLSSFKQ
jgi:site-specific recombinase XerD